MEYLIDKESEILWYKDEVSKDSDEVSKELNYWSSPEITEYIIGEWNDIPLGKFTKYASDFDMHNR